METEQVGQNHGTVSRQTWATWMWLLLYWVNLQGAKLKVHEKWLKIMPFHKAWSNKGRKKESICCGLKALLKHETSFSFNFSFLADILPTQSSSWSNILSSKKKKKSKLVKNGNIEDRDNTYNKYFSIWLHFWKTAVFWGVESCFFLTSRFALEKECAHWNLHYRPEGT